LLVIAAWIGLSNVDFHCGYIEELPVPDGWADVIISNGVVNLAPDEARVFGEMRRVLSRTPRGRSARPPSPRQRSVDIGAMDDTPIVGGGREPCLTPRLL